MRNNFKRFFNFKFFIFLGATWSLLAFLSYALLPKMPIWGADVSMQYFFHKCINFDPSKTIYAVSGNFCGDNINLFYAYPPIIFRFFSFSRLFNDYNNFYYFYVSLVFICIFSIPFIMRKFFTNISISSSFLLSILLLFQAPSYYSLERGGTDIIFTIPWMFASIFFLQKKIAFAAILMCLSVLLKLYPAIAILCVTLSYIHFKKYLSKDFCIYALSGGVSTVFFILVDFNLWKDFFTIALTKANSMPIGTNAISHSLVGPFNKFIVYALMFYFCFSFSKLIASKNNDLKALGLFTAIGFSTYFSNHSFDYNLVTIYPLIIFLIFSQIDDSNRLFRNKYLILSIALFILTIFGPSNLVFSAHKYTIKLKLLLQIISFQLIYIGCKPLIAGESTEKVHA